ncbi:hypothetical protein M0804_007323 [Polistes exclamans]|nr:hypothetical protein M0804_007323 [Polistes exclamans]
MRREEARGEGRTAGSGTKYEVVKRHVFSALPGAIGRPCAVTTTLTRVFLSSHRLNHLTISCLSHLSWCLSRDKLSKANLYPL